MAEQPSKIPRLHVRSVEGVLGLALAATSNRAGLLQLRCQIDRVLEGENSYPFEEAIYRNVDGEPFEVAVKLARRREEMREPVPKPEKTPERIPWTELARRPEERRERSENG